MGALLKLEKPLLAAIHGPCVGGGLVVALTADLRFAADDAVFRVPAARLGIGYEAAGVQALAGVVGWSHALDLLLSARRIDAEEARRIGLVNEVRPAAALDDFVRERADRIAENAPLTLRALKIAARELRKPEGLRDLDAMNAAYGRCFSSEDYKEGVAAFLHKRKPVFRGR
jgi:enoyl-CoA hydratase